MRLTDKTLGETRIILRQKVCRDSGDPAITESIDRDWHSLQYFEERGFPTALILLECRSLGFDCLFPNSVLLIRSHQDRESILLRRTTGRSGRVYSPGVTGTRKLIAS